jgi:hypothetical protein
MTMGVGPVIRRHFSPMTANALTGVRAMFDGDLSLTSPTVLHVELPCA